MTLRTYSQEEINAFETAMAIVLPDAYKRYLIEVGAGQARGSKVSLLEDWCQPRDPESLPSDFLLQPFPFIDSWNDVSLLDVKAGWRAAYYDPMWFRGSMRIVSLGCEGYHLLVVSGPERGNVWCDHRASFTRGVFPYSRGNKLRVTVAEYLWEAEQL